MATFEQIKIQVKLLPDFAARQEVGDYLLSLAVNDAQRRFHEELNSRFEQKTGTTIETIVGTRDYTLPTDYKEAQMLFYRLNGVTDKAEMVRRSKEWFDVYYPDPADTGTPSDWMIWAGSLRVGPTPDTANDDLVFDYSAFKAALVDGSPTNTNDLTVQFPEALRWAAAESAAMYAGLDMERVKAFNGLYLAALKRAKRVIVAEDISGQAIVMKTPG